MRNWPFEFPGERGDGDLKVITQEECEHSLSKFGAAVQKCNKGFEGGQGEALPIYPIQGSTVDKVHKAQEEGWKLLTQEKGNNPVLFGSHDEL